MSIKTSLVDNPVKDDFSMDMFGRKTPILVYNSAGTIALLINHDTRKMHHTEADAVIVYGRNTGEYVEKLNLEQFKPYPGGIIIRNKDK